MHQAVQEPLLQTRKVDAVAAQSSPGDSPGVDTFTVVRSGQGSKGPGAQPRPMVGCDDSRGLVLAGELGSRGQLLPEERVTLEP